MGNSQPRQCGTPARQTTLNQSFLPVQAQAPRPTSQFSTTCWSLSVAAASAQDLLRELYALGWLSSGPDGGADKIVAAGLKPELIIGDFDSLKNPHAWLGKTRLMQIAEQETTDFEKAIYSARRR